MTSAIGNPITIPSTMSRTAQFGISKKWKNLSGDLDQQPTDDRVCGCNLVKRCAASAQRNVHIIAARRIHATFEVCLAERPQPAGQPFSRPIRRETQARDIALTRGSRSIAWPIGLLP